MRNTYLLDTHVLYWLLHTPEKLSPGVQQLLQHQASTPIISIVSAWELATKSRIGKIILPPTFFADINEPPFVILPVKTTHVGVYQTLPLLHRDPFDRMLVAQAIAEDIPLITADANCMQYAARTILAL